MCNLKNFILLLTLSFTILTASAQIKSPADYLGYEIGTQYTPHYKLVDYFKHVAANSKMVQLKQYGQTNEHRPLIVVFVGTENNISSLENIRANNMRLARQGDGQTGITQAPAITWLSYNVHGNEPTSSEAAMLTLYALVDPSNTQTKQWLQNSIVVIDPCLNPDGRDRYVNWFNGVVGKNYNSLPFTREHREPWPQGRSNHYNFDLNRDWAWQTQVESRQRVALYNQWLPQVHVDFHEQGYNSPYYFAPAAEPYHNILTKWQRDFQKVIGKNNAKYFDQNDWLYFTNERFDLFYPSYGDTYPLYNGSIGMTYEQGGIGGGLGVITNEGDTLTLVERVKHHYTTGLSTIEAASQNAAALVKEFQTYFTNAAEGKMTSFKTYIIKHSMNDEQRLSSLKELLNRNGISFGTASGKGKGFHYLSKKEEAFNIEAKDLVIAADQPKAALVEVLFEPNAHLNDSVTYDITAWAMPYAYGLQAYASKQIFKVNVSANETVKNAVADPYGYIFSWSSGGSLKAVAQMLKEGIRLRFAEKGFTANKRQFHNGAVIILKNGNTKFGNRLWERVRAIADKNNVPLFETGSGMADNGADFGSSLVHAFKSPKVVLLTGEGVNAYAAGEVWSYFDNELEYPISLVNTNDMGYLDWSKTDVIIMPDGSYNFLNNKDQQAQLMSWVRGGGKIIALERAVQQLSKQDWSLLKERISKEDTLSKKDSIKTSNYANREKEYVSENTPGAIFKVTVDNTHPLMFGYADYYYTLKMDGVMYEPMQKGGWNAGIIKADKQLAGFVGNKLSKNLKNALLFGVQDVGRGSVVYLADDVLFRNFWENGKLMFGNAVFLVGQ